MLNEKFTDYTNQRGKDPRDPDFRDRVNLSLNPSSSSSGSRHPLFLFSQSRVRFILRIEYIARTFNEIIQNLAIRLTTLGHEFR